MSKDVTEENLGKLTYEDTQIAVLEIERLISRNVDILAGYKQDSANQQNIINSRNTIPHNDTIIECAEILAREDGIFINIYTKRIIALKKVLLTLK